MEELVDDSDVEVRLALAKYTRVDLTIYTLLSNDPVSKIRAAVARHPHLPEQQQVVLATDAQPMVRAALARNKDCTTKCLQKLSRDDKPAVRRAVAAHPRLMTVLIRKLSKDSDEKVRENLWKRADLSRAIRELLNKEFGERPVKTAKQPKSSKSVELPTNLAGDKLLLETFRTFKTFYDKDDYNELSANLKKLYKTLPYEQRDKLFDSMSAEQKQKLPRNFARNYAAILPKNPKPGFNRLLALMLDECPTDIIAKAMRSNDWLERLAVATHPKAPPSTLKILCNDGNKWVRQAAENAIQQQEKAA